MELGVLEWQPTSEWASPSFIQPKKNGTLQFLTDFRKVNEMLVRKPFPLPKISTMYLYHHKYSCKRLPMGIAGSLKIEATLAINPPTNVKELR